MKKVPVLLWINNSKPMKKIVLMKPKKSKKLINHKKANQIMDLKSLTKIKSHPTMSLW